MNRFIKVLLAMCICMVGICCMSISASADTVTGTCGTNVTWSYDSDTTTLTISGTGDMTTSSSSIPWSSYKASITTVVIEDGVTSIGNYAFYVFTALKSITIPDSVTSIGETAFQGCSSLTSVTIPNSVTSIGSRAFYNCTSLTSITIPDSVTSIGSYAFGWSGLTSIIIPGSVTSIGIYTFYNCSSLTSAHYLGSEDSLTIGNNNASLTNVIHYMTLHEATVTCTDDGYIEYYSCDTRNCNVVIYKGDGGNYATTTADDTKLTLTATGHTYIYTSYGTGTHVITCEYCDYTDTEECIASSDEWTTDETAHYKTCSVCEGYAEYDTHETNDYYTTDTQHAKSCSVCGYYDENSLEDHTEAYTDNEDDSTHTVYCSVCDYIISSSTDHTYTYAQGEAGTHAKACEYCAYITTEDCSYADDDYVDCGDGENHYRTCLMCEAQNTFAHEEAEAVVENNVDPTCTETGSYDSVVYCAACDTEISRETTIVDANGHSYSTETCIDGTTIDTCSVCSDVVVTVADSDDTDNFKVVLKESIEITEDLENADYDSEEAIKSALIEYLAQASGVEVVEGSNAVIYDVVLLFREDGGDWQIATVDNFPAEGITVVFDYPDDTDADSYNFYVAHMFAYTSEALGTTAGAFEYPTVTKTADGIQVTLTGLSPVIVSWDEIVVEEEEEEEEDEEEETTTDEDSTEEETDSEEDTDDTTDDSNTDETDSEDTTDTDNTTTTDTSDSTSTSTYTNAYIQYIGGILMSGNTSTSTVEDVSTGAGMAAESSAGGSALAVVSLLGVAVMMARKRR